MSDNGRVVRVASGQGFWGDDLEAPVRQVEGGSIDYLMLDYLAEVTMSIMQKQRARDPAAGYARDFVPSQRFGWKAQPGRHSARARRARANWSDSSVAGQGVENGRNLCARRRV